jgi:transcriptional regulator with XRE-family HTH domain
MKLKEYLDAQGLRYDRFAEKLGVTKTTMYNCILREGYDPKASFIDLVEKLTKKQVTYKDWISSVKKVRLEALDKEKID